MKVTVFSTKGRKRSEVNAEVATWGELKSVLAAEGIETEGMRAIIGESQVTLESSKALLPVDFDFTLFLSPIKVKSGADVENMSYKECKEFIKLESAKSAEAKEHFGNYTIMSTSQLRALIESYLSNATATVDTKVETNVEEVDVVSLVDMTIDLLKEIKSRILNNVETNDDEEEAIANLEAWFAEIKANI